MPDIEIDMYESLPVPFGLVRFGVAPDHPEVKNCIQTFSAVATSPTFTFIGNTPIGDAPGHLTLSSLLPHYDASLFTYGASKDRKLGIPGEDLTNVISARAFVGWYNGLPEYADLDPNLEEGEIATVIGQGNVALDVARILLSPLANLRQTDIAEHAVEALSKNKVKHVQIVGRRGPLQAPYTIKEIREMISLPSVAFGPLPSGLLPDHPKKLPRQLKRIAEILQKGSTTKVEDADKSWELKYMMSPVAFNAAKDDSSRLNSVTFDQTVFVETSHNPSSPPEEELNRIRGLRVRSTGKQITVPTSLAFRSVGYVSEPLPGLLEAGIPFDTKRGIIPTDVHGRVLPVNSDTAESGGSGQTVGIPGGGGWGGDGREKPIGEEEAKESGAVPGFYCAGWVKTGPTGVIASTMADAFGTADAIICDRQRKSTSLSRTIKGGWEEVRKEAKSRGIRTTDWKDWERIDAYERDRGREKGKERVKCRSVKEMLDVIGA
ncbi:NADPH-adrenodoxin reductase [Elasticomyces elasticus]|nr:NADPH-adrenodoxin reductase [Elasticomyces elasticus]